MKYYLHYVASGKNGIYGKDVFIKEASKIGVNRSLPYFLIKKLKWGDKILLANFENRHAGEKTDDEKPKLKKFQDGIANVFGYFVIEGLNLTASNELKEKLYSQLNIISSNNNAMTVKRSCGSYIVSSSHSITDTIKEVIEKAQVLAKEMDEKVKYFIGGNFYKIDTKIEGVNFSRSIVEIDIEEIQNNTDFGNYVGFIKDYNKNTYIPKKERV